MNELNEKVIMEPESLKDVLRKAEVVADDCQSARETLTDVP